MKVEVEISEESITKAVHAAGVAMFRGVAGVEFVNKQVKDALPAAVKEHVEKLARELVSNEPKFRELVEKRLGRLAVVAATSTVLESTPRKVAPHAAENFTRRVEMRATTHAKHSARSNSLFCSESRFRVNARVETSEFDSPWNDVLKPIPMITPHEFQLRDRLTLAKVGA